ncbi:TVG0769271 [Thermoplasma volcanium GSS1]|uniref:TVG0769271 protein n=1 Tax=Thermoplasma volcanium (strain ATCC 51530 / DSM 4299 / JCM 9571 / NBRC 15438 / GSS1) TaxID=273116 RepID=Q97AP5_THEVO|nr:hypothetical protein [Thermoplasma volcanium]BAB59907.1 TVG0769271 [Thermoplasma volcanium GSS1]
MDRRDIPGLVFGLFSIVLSIGVLIYYLPDIIYKASIIAEMPSAYYALLSFKVNSLEIYTFTIISIIVLLISIISLRKFNADKTTSFSKIGGNKFFWYLSIYVFFDLLLSFIISSIYPSYGITSINSYPQFQQVYYYSVSVIFDTILFQAIPITVMLGIYAIVAKKPRIMLNSSGLNWNIIGAIAIISATYSSIIYILLGQNIFYTISIYVSSIIMTIIYVKFGFLRAFLGNFIISMVSYLSVLVHTYPLYSLLFTLYLFAWASVGIYYMFVENEARHTVQKSQKQKEEVKREPVQIPMLGPSDLFIRSVCPECGGVVFHVKEDMSLECDHCHHVLAPEDVGPFNVKVDIYGRLHDHFYEPTDIGTQ